MNEAVSNLGIDWNHLWLQFQTQSLDFALDVVAAIAIFWLGSMAARLVSRGLNRVMIARGVDPILQSFFGTLISWGLMAVVVIAAIRQIGVETASLIALLGAAGIAVGLAMQGSLANFAAGVLIVIFRPYRVGDWIEAAGTAGSVVRVQLLTTELSSADNRRIIVPNRQIMEGIITNYSALGTRRLELVFGVGYADDIDKVRETIRALVDADERILEEPPCDIVVGELGASSVNFFVRPWTRTADYWPVRFDLIEAVKKRFDELGIRIPYPQQDVHLIREEA